MDFKLSEEQLAKKKEFDDFFREEMNKALEKYPDGEAFEGIFTDIGWEHFQYMKKKAGGNRLSDHGLAQRVRGAGCIHHRPAPL